MRRKEYYGLLQDPKWKIKAQFIRKRDGHKCQHCGKKTPRLQVHHTVYIDGLKPWEYENDTLVSLCSTCHKKEHGITKSNKKAKVVRKKKEIVVNKKKTRTIQVKIIDENT